MLARASQNKGLDPSMQNRTSEPPTGAEHAPAIAGIDNDSQQDPDFPGLVSSAVFRPSEIIPDDPGELFRGLYRFPSAEMLAVAAAMWPTAPRPRDREGAWHRILDSPEGDDGWSTVRYNEARRSRVYSEYHTEHEGQWPRIEIAPGLVRFARTDDNRAERSRARAADRESERNKAFRENFVDRTIMPMWAAPDEISTDHRDVISAWSAKSRANLRATIASLDLSVLVAGETPPAMVTLTLPGDWLAVAPTAAVMAKKFDGFRLAYEKKWKVKLACIWKREFQRRGAPHYHLWVVPPVEPGRLEEFRAWLSASWTRTIFRGVEVVLGADHVEPQDCNGVPFHTCSCSEFCRSLLAGTGLDFAQALRSRDPNRLAEYFLKEAGHSEAKAYQNAAPTEWEGQSIGRFWGVRGLDKSVIEIPIRPQDQYTLWRVLRKVREHRAPVRIETVARVNTKTGEVRLRRVRRRAKVRGIAGWVAVNDGASFGADLGRFASLLAARADTLELCN